MSEPYTISGQGPGYPSSLQTYLGDSAPAEITALGNVDILQNKTIALFCSSQCPGHIIIKTYDIMKEIRADGSTVISGFHSPMELE
jgi:predicted Rossmann fold nucleotide-binding protein DprA/Smf involved in DNA uptake